jgi:hypothetical protein
MANTNNWGEIYKSTWWGDEDWSANSLKIDSAPPGFAGGQNLLKASEDMNITRDWSQFLISVAANSTDEAAPNATDTAEKLTFTDAPQSRIQQQIALEANTTYTFSVYAKVRTGTKAFRLRNVTLGQAQQFTADTSWGLNPDDGRYSFSFTTGATAITHTLSIQNAAAAGTGEVFFWGAMLNEGATAGDYVKTDASVGGSAPAPAYSGFGDAFGGVTAYYSLRQFTEAETLNAIRVRRSSDDTEQDIGFDGEGNLDTTALLAFVGTGGTDNGFVTKWYDQSGNSNDAINATASEQPKIVSSGTTITQNGKPCLDFDGNNNGYELSDQALITSLTNGTQTAISVHSVDDVTGSADNLIYSVSDRNGVYNLFGLSYRSNEARAGYFNGSSWSGKKIAASNNTQYLGFNVVVSGAPDFYQNNSQAVSSSNPTMDGNQGLSIGKGTNNNWDLSGTIQELIFFASDQSSNRGTVTTGGGTGIEGNINTYFDIV